MDEEVRRIVTGAHEQVIALLQQNRDRLDGLAQALLEHDTLGEDDILRVAGIVPVTVTALDQTSNGVSAARPAD